MEREKMEEDFTSGPKEGIEAVEWARKAYYEQYRKDMRVLIGICVPILGLLLWAMIRSGTLTFVVFGIILVVIGQTIVRAKNYKLYNRYELAYKKYFVQGMLRQVFPGCEYAQHAGIKKQEIEEIGMMDLGDRYSSEDLVTGEYNGVKFKQADVVIQEEHRDDNGGTSYVTTFKGRYAIFDIKKKFEFRLAVVGRGFGVIELRNKDKLKKFKQRTVESEEFHKRFKVYAEDGFEAFYLLDPAIIERIQRLGEQYNNRVAIFFYKGFMHIAIKDYSDSFQVPSPSKPISEGAEFGKVREDLMVLTDLVDGLKLVGE